jgi:hypothetical protein
MQDMRHVHELMKLFISGPKGSYILISSIKMFEIVYIGYGESMLAPAPVNNER